MNVAIEGANRDKIEPPTQRSDSQPLSSFRKTKHDRMIENLTKLLLTNPNIRSMGIIDTYIDKYGMSNIVKAMDHNTKVQKRKKEVFNPFSMK